MEADWTIGETFWRRAIRFGCKAKWFVQKTKTLISLPDKSVFVCMKCVAFEDLNKKSHFHFLGGGNLFLGITAEDFF